MGSLGNPSNTNWPPYNGYRDCSQGICSIYCPQWCYMIFPPPPPAPVQSQDDYDSSDRTNFSPLIIAFIGILATAFLLISYYTIITKYCKRNRANQLNPTPESDLNPNPLITHDHWQLATVGLDESVIKSIAVCRYHKGNGVVEGYDCAICLAEFQEGENLRLLPKCNHAFHLPCIDTWLSSHSSCPLCRSHVMPGVPIPFHRTAESHIPSSNFHISSLEFQRRNDLLLVVENNEVVVNIDGNGTLPKCPFQQVECSADGIMIPILPMGIGEAQDFQEINPNLLIGDILRLQEDYEDHHHVGSSKGENSKSNKRSNSIKRSVSTGRFMFSRNDKGKDSVLPN